MSVVADAQSATLSAILAAVHHYWGYDELRPLQAEAIQAGLQRRDSLVVLPTGGGKSLCYQVPPALAGRTDVVVSPLISLMKDQVDGLRQCGYPAVALHSGLPAIFQREIEKEIRAGRPHLVFVAPERLLSPGFVELLERLSVRAFAIDEAHCISHWGHDFRPEYRRLAVLKQRYPKASIHAYTATATERVRQDIVAQLQLEQPTTLVGIFDRPNLIYRVIPRIDSDRQILEVIERHRGQAVIVYCITRKDTEHLATWLQAAGARAACYHAGLGAELRRTTQERFAREEIDVVVATVAFGMGIDRSDVRCVVHAALPKSLEHYQQETGRAGRDGLEAECVLFYSPADALRWEALIRRSAEDAQRSEEVIAAGLELLGHIRAYAAGLVCRHKVLSEHFGQPYEKPNCEACDVCLDEGEVDQEATVIAQKILSCVARVEQRFGVGHVVKVLTGSNDKQVRSFGHDRLSTFGLLKDLDAKKLMNLVYQLIEQGVLNRTHSDRPILKLNAASWEVMRGERHVRLVLPKQRVVKATKIQAESWEDVDRGLFESLRELRRTIAVERGVPAYIIFGDAALRDMARRRPRTPEEFLAVHGVGETKLKSFGARFLDHIKAYLGANSRQSSADSNVVGN
ncbi:MAG: DNA helicase RecQ [Phycisphaerae bacterium]|nr:DNA helicase RecQ [Phycisphaerae bacterium]